MVQFSEADARRIGRAVKRVERMDQSAPIQAGTQSPRVPQVEIVRVTSLTLDSGRYPGKVQLYDSVASTYSDLGDCWIVGINGAGLALQKYLARRVGDTNGRPVFLATVGIFSGANVYNNSDQTLSGLTTLTFSNESFDTDAYHSTSSNTSRLVVPTTGKYIIGANLLITPSADNLRSAVATMVASTGDEICRGGFSLPAAATFGFSSHSINMSTVWDLTAADYVEVKVTATLFGAGSIVSSVVTPSTPSFWITRHP